MSRIVIIDYTPQYVDLMPTILVKRGHTIITFPPARDAVEAVGLAAPDLLILDLEMAPTNGLDLMVRMAADDKTRDMPVLVCSASATELFTTIPSASEQCGYRFLPKPFDLAVFIEQVEEMLSSRRRAASPSEREQSSTGLK